MRIAHTCLRVADAKQSVEWYTENFGFEETWSWDWETDRGHAVNRYIGDGEGAELQLVETEGWTEFEQGEQFDHIGIVVDSVDEAFEQIDNHGVDIPPQDNPASNSRIAFIRDPDGNRIELLEPFD